MISLFTRLLIFIVILYETQSNLDLCSFQELKNEPRSMKPLRTFIPSWGASGSSETSDVTSGSCGLRFVVCCVVDNELFFFHLSERQNKCQYKWTFFFCWRSQQSSFTSVWKIIKDKWKNVRVKSKVFLKVPPLLQQNPTGRPDVLPPGWGSLEPGLTSELWMLVCFGRPEISKSFCL